MQNFLTQRVLNFLCSLTFLLFIPPLTMGKDTANRSISPIAYLGLGVTAHHDGIIANASINSNSRPSSGHLVLNKLTSQSSTTAYGDVFSFAVDGNSNGSWGSNSVTHIGNTEWWEVDFPNIAYDSINIGGIMEDQHIQLLGISGRLILETINREIDISQLERGDYFIRTRTVMYTAIY